MSSFCCPDLSSMGRIRARMRAIKETLDGPAKAPISGKDRFVDVLAGEEGKRTDRKERVARAGDVSLSSGHAVTLEEISGSVGSVHGDVDAIVRRKAGQYGLDETLVRSVIRMESGGNPRAVSKAGAMGVMQLMPGTAEMLGVADPFDPEQNVDGGVRYLKRLLERYDGDETKALAAYHSGPGNVDRYGGVPPHPAVNRYVECVLAMVRREREGR